MTSNVHMCPYGGAHVNMLGAHMNTTQKTKYSLYLKEKELNITDIDTDTVKCTF
jgi:hypothetical protein